MADRVPLPIVARWITWSRASANRRILAAAITVGALTLVANLVVVLKDLLVVYRFGPSDAVDALLIAWLLPSFFVGVIAESFSSSLVPRYVAVRERDGPARARELFQQVLAWSVVLLVVVSVLLWLASPWLLDLVGGRFDGAKLEVTRRLFWLLLPCLLLSGVSSIWGAVINAGEKFASVALAGVAVPVGAILGLTLGSERWGIAAVAAGTTAGYVLRCVWLGVEVRRRVGAWSPRFAPMDDEVRGVFRQYLPTVSASFLMTSTLVVDQAMAATLPGGSVATLAYGIKVVAFVLGLASLALGTAVLPHLSAMVSRQDWTSLRRTVAVYSRLVLAGGAVVALVFVLASVPIVRLLYERGAFTPADTGPVAQVQALAVLQIPFYLLGALLVRLAFAMQRSHLLFFGTLISVPLNIALNWWFMQRLGVAGIALSTSCVYLVSAVFLWTMLIARADRREAAAA